MDNKKKVEITIDLGEVCNDILADSNLISQTILDTALADIRANVQSPDGSETLSIVCRSVTEAIDKLKAVAQRYMTTGRTEDDNTLERLGTETNGVTTYEKVELELAIPNWNTAVTGHLKSQMHRYIVVWTMYKLLQNQVPDKAKEYKELSTETEDQVKEALIARENYALRKPSFV